MHLYRTDQLLTWPREDGGVNPCSERKVGVAVGGGGGYRARPGTGPAAKGRTVLIASCRHRPLRRVDAQ